MNNSKRQPLYSRYYWILTFLLFLGLLASGYLSYTHYKNYTDITYASFCAITQAINCDTVAQSPWSIFFNLPLSILGIFFYTGCLLFIAPFHKSNEIQWTVWKIFTALLLIASGVSVYLAFVSFQYIHSFCIICIFTYAINFVTSYTALIIYTRFSRSQPTPSEKKSSRHSYYTRYAISCFLILAIALAATWAYFPKYWNLQEKNNEAQQLDRGITAEGNPWVGTENATITIEEFTDYQCFQCRKMHYFLKKLLINNKNIKLIHRNFPLDDEFNRILTPQPYHVGSGKLALIAVVALRHDKFWAINDELYALMRNKKKAQIDILPLAELIGITPQQLVQEMYEKRNLDHLRHDIVVGMKAGVKGTPSFIVDGQLYEQTLPPALLHRSPEP